MGRLRTAWDQMLGRNPGTEQRSLNISGLSGPTFVSGSALPSPLGAGFQGTLSSVPFFAAVRLITDNFAATPLQAFRGRLDGGADRVGDPTFLKPLFGSRAAWKTQCIMSLLGRGNAYGFITDVDNRGYPLNVVWLDPAQMWCDENIIRPVFQYQGNDVDSSRLIHVPWIVVPGKVTGLSPVQLFRQTFEMGTDAQALAATMFRNNGIPIGHLKNVEKTLDVDEAARISERFHASTKQRKNFVSGSDWEYKALSMPPDDLRFIEAIKLTATQVASIFGIAPDEIGGEAANSLTYSTLEQNALKLATQTMRPFFVRVEEALSDFMPRGSYLKFNADAGVRADLKTRMEAHDIAVRNGVETVDEARALEERTPMTKSEFTQWQQMFGFAQERHLTVPEAIAKTYLGVGNIVDSKEARDIVNTFGAALPETVPEFDIQTQGQMKPGASDDNWDDAVPTSTTGQPKRKP